MSDPTTHADPAHDPWLEDQPLAIDPARDEDYEPGRRPPSILILTKDEEINLRQCLETLRFSDDIVVFDSLSNDRTIEIAREFPNVRVIKRKFDTWSRHSNWALENIQWKHPWVYYSDADERVTPELADEIIRQINDQSQPHAAYRLRYKNMFMGKWVRRGGLYPVWIIRLFKPDKIRYEDRQVNAHPVVDGTLGSLSEHFIHYSFNKGLVPWFNKHNSYSDMESGEALRVTNGSLIAEIRKVFGDDAPLERRRGIKNLSFFIPFRALARFVYMYFVRLGLLDGRAGFEYACMISMYEYWIELKMRESRNRWLDRTLERANEILQREQVAGGGIARDA